ncbi:hypothetical protein MRF4_24885 [Methylobacterium radiotolerans]|uniref:alpha/beta fold hydrolase BchO n=1 Tax=Methylobacterium radiotolerans TaxID=31998 RepID=UPI002F34A055
MTPARKLTDALMRLGPAVLPFADAATAELPLGRLLRLALFQVTVGMAAVLLIGTLNRVMIVELGVPAWIVAMMLALPLVFAPLRALVGFRSDTHRSVLGWRRVPYIWFGTLLQFGGLAIMPFALLILSGDTTGPLWVGDLAAALAFLLVGAGLHTTQTVGLALATDLAPAHARPKVVALLCAALLFGMMASAVLFGLFLAHFSAVRLIQVIQGAALVTIILNGFALWKQEPRDPNRTRTAPERDFRSSWRAYAGQGTARRRLVAIGLGTAGFSMQDILLEPYGGQILHLSVGATTALTALLAAGGGLGLLVAARWLGRGGDPFRVSAVGVPVLAAGHSAGAAVLARMCLDGSIAPRLLTAFNGALAPLPGAANLLFPSMARLLFLNPFTPRIFAWTADRSAARRLIEGTGSRLDPEGVDLYRRLFARAGHVRGALGMMANWDLAGLHRALPGLATRTLLIVGGDDKAILPDTAFALRDRLPDARVRLIRGLGHLAHEEAPERVAEVLRAEASEAGVLSPP